jgi:hypothetical protein
MCFIRRKYVKEMLLLTVSAQLCSTLSCTLFSIASRVSIFFHDVSQCNKFFKVTGHLKALNSVSLTEVTVENRISRYNNIKRTDTACKGD